MSAQPEALRIADECEQSADEWRNEVDTRMQAASELRRLVAENEALNQRWQRVIKAAEEAHGPAAFRFKLGLRKNGTATNQFPTWLDGRWVSFVYAENDAHLGLHAKVEIQCTLLRQALEALEADDWQKKLQAANVIRQHMEGKA